MSKKGKGKGFGAQAANPLLIESGSETAGFEGVRVLPFALISIQYLAFLAQSAGLSTQAFQIVSAKTPFFFFIKLKDFRSTCAQMIKTRNKGPVEMATKQLGHSGPDTTYRFYAQLQSDAVFEELDRMFMPEGDSQQSKIVPSASNPDGKTFLIPGENISAG